MTTRTKKLAPLLVAGVALSSGAYAIGSQTGGGGAVASGGAAATAVPASSASSGGRTPGERRLSVRGPDRVGLSVLADRLGVTSSALRDALQAIRGGKAPEQWRTELTQALATALGKPAADVQKAVESVLPDRRDRGADFAATLAKELGVDTAKVQAGLDKARRQFHDQRAGSGRRTDRFDAVVNAIASSTGVDAAKVRAALDKLRPTRGDRHDRRDDLRRRLATALGVTTSQLDAAFDKVRTDQRDAFATALAQRLNLDAQKVKDALRDFPGPGRRHP
jgi:protein-disulfide isomerase-like protein with CxxC motif